MPEDLTCPNLNCWADLTEPGSVVYLSGDGMNTHFERRENGDIALVLDSEGECDSMLYCTKCGTPVGAFPYENEVWD